MTTIQIIFGLLITLFFAARAFSVKIGTKTLDSSTITLSSSLFLVCVTVIMAIIMDDWFVLPNLSFGDSLIAVFGAIAKGISLYFAVKFTAEVARESNSSSVFAGFIALGIAAPLLGEAITTWQLLSCVLLGVLGFAFFARGPAAELDKSGKITFAFLIISLIACMTMDRITIPVSGWFFYFAVSNITFFVLSLIACMKKSGFKFVHNFSFPIMWAIGIIFTLGEITVIYSYEEILTVTMGSLFIRMATPIVMVASAFLWKESTPQKQLAFGILALLLAIPILL